MLYFKRSAVDFLWRLVVAIRVHDGRVEEPWSPLAKPDNDSIGCKPLKRKVNYPNKQKLLSLLMLDSHDTISNFDLRRFFLNLAHCSSYDLGLKTVKYCCMLLPTKAWLLG